MGIFSFLTKPKLESQLTLVDYIRSKYAGEVREMNGSPVLHSHLVIVGASSDYELIDNIIKKFYSDKGYSVRKDGDMMKVSGIDNSVTGIRVDSNPDGDLEIKIRQMSTPSTSRRPIMYGPMKRKV